MVRPLAAFVRLSRLPFLYGGFAGVALGAAVAHAAGRSISLPAYLLAQTLVTAFHLMVHYANDYFDREVDLRGVDARTAWSGGSGVLAGGDLPAHVGLTAALVCAALGLAASVAFAFAGRLVVAALGAAILAFAWAYSAPPLRLCARGLGELDTALVVGVLVPCVGYAAFTGVVDARIVATSLPCAVTLVVMMLSVEIPDAAVDALGEKRTLVVRWTLARAYRAMLAIVALAMVLTTIAATVAAGWRGTAAVAPALAFGIALAWTVAAGERTPGRVAFLGVALYAATVTGLAVAQVFALHR